MTPRIEVIDDGRELEAYMDGLDARLAEAREERIADAVAAALQAEKAEKEGAQ